MPTAVISLAPAELARLIASQSKKSERQAIHVATAHAKERRLARQQPVLPPVPPKPLHAAKQHRIEMGRVNGGRVRVEPRKHPHTETRRAPQPSAVNGPEPAPSVSPPPSMGNGSDPARQHQDVPTDLIEQFRAEFRADYRRLAQIEARREAGAAVDGDQAAYVADVNARSPGWWPRQLKMGPPRRRPPSAHRVAAADSRLREIRTKLEAGVPLTVNEEAEAEAILKLMQVWKADPEARQKATQAPVGANAMPMAPLIGPSGLKLPTIPRRGVGGYEAAACMTWE